MAATADAVIIGGGVMGLCAALHLSERGVQRVTLLEKRCVGAGSSGKSGAILRQHYSHETTIRMSRESLQFYASFQDAHGHDIGFRRTPMVFVCSERDRVALEANVRTGTLNTARSEPATQVSRASIQRNFMQQ